MAVNWWDNLGDDAVTVMKSNLTPFGYMSPRDQDTFKEAHPKGDLAYLSRMGQWEDARPDMECPWEGIVYRIRVDWQRPAPQWWDGMSPHAVSALKENTSAFGLMSKWKQDAILAIRTLGHSVVFSHLGVWSRVGTAAKNQPGVDRVYRLHHRWPEVMGDYDD